MEILSEHKVDRDLVKINGIELIRIKTYNSINSESNIEWYFRKDKIKVKNLFIQDLEEKFNKLKRKNATIINRL